MKKKRESRVVFTESQWNDILFFNNQLKAQLTDANETIRQNRLTIERMQEKYNALDNHQAIVWNDQHAYKEIALNLSRHLVQTSQSFEDKYPER